MAEIVKDAFAGMPWYLYLILILAIALLVAGFLVPPMGIIDGSVLKAVGLILGGTWLLYTTANIPVFIQSGAKIKASYGNAELTIGKTKNNDKEILSENANREIQNK